jgi:predicted TIM-barrel fold metal-dependent hydrolase
MNTRGADKVMFATDYPLLSFDRCINEVRELPLRDHVWPKFLRENAIKVFGLKD